MGYTNIINMNNLNQKISIVMNCYNGEEYLSEAIDSVINQTYQNWELIFWDNRSTDKSREILNSYTDNRIMYYLSEAHTTQYEARRRAVQKCKGEFIAFLDVDDYWAVNKIAKQIPFFENPDIGFVCSNAWIVDDRKNKIYKAFNKLPSGRVLNDLLKKNFITMSSLVLRRTKYMSLKTGFNPNYEIIGDFDLLLQLALISNLGSVNEQLTYYRWHSDNLRFNQLEKNISELDKLYIELKKNKKVIAEKNFDLFFNNIQFNRGLINILKDKRLNCFKIIRNMTSIYHIFKMFITLMLPKKIILSYRNR